MAEVLAEEGVFPIPGDVTGVVVVVGDGAVTGGGNTGYGGGLVGVELAEFLAERGREVTVLEESPVLAAEMALPRRWRILYTLREHGVQLLHREGIDDVGATAQKGRAAAGACHAH